MQSSSDTHAHKDHSSGTAASQNVPISTGIRTEISHESSLAPAAPSPLRCAGGEFWRSDKPNCVEPHLFHPHLQQHIPGSDISIVSVQRLSRIRPSHLTVGTVLALFILVFAQHPELCSDHARALFLLANIPAFTQAPYEDLKADSGARKLSSYIQRQAKRLEDQDFKRESREGFLQSKIYSELWKDFVEPEPQPVLTEEQSGPQQEGADIGQVEKRKHYLVPVLWLVIGKDKKLVPPTVIVKS
jgi:hypothetical protein